MRIALVGVALSVFLLASGARAQVIVDMNAVKCSQYLAMGLGVSRDFSAWMSGWFSYQTRKTFVDIDAHQQNISNVKDWCKYHMDEKVMTGLQNAIGNQ